MARNRELHAFYTSKAWRKFRLGLIAERGNRCERCGVIVARSLDLHGHHKVELTAENMADANLALNPKKVDLICHDCHDMDHKRFAHQNKKEVFIVYGPPFSGKRDYVAQNMMRGDLILDMDSLYESISGLPRYDKPNRLYGNVVNIYNTLMDNVKTRYGKWGNAWIIGGYPDKYKRERLANELGAELVYIDSPIEECISVAPNAEYVGYINKWFEQYVE